MAIIIGSALYKQFDFETLSFENTALALVYMFGIGVLVYFEVPFIVQGHMGRAK